MDKYNFNKVSIKSGESKFLNTLYKTKGITLIALVITIVVMLLLVSIGLSLALGKGGLVEKAITGKQEARKSEVYFNVVRKAAGIVTQAQGKNFPTEEIDKKLDEYFSKPKVQKELENIQKENGLSSIEEVKGKVLNDIGWAANTSSSTLPPIKDEDRAPMILSMDLAPNIKLAVSQFPENCYVDWGDGVKSKSLQSTQTGVKDVKIYGNFNTVSLGVFGPGIERRLGMFYDTDVVNYPDMINLNINQTTPITVEDMKNFNQSILGIKDWGENNFKEISFFTADKLTEVPTPRQRSFENLEYAPFFLYGTRISKINPDLFAYAPKLKSVIETFSISSFPDIKIPDNLFRNCTNLEYVWDQFTNNPEAVELFKNNKKLKVFGTHYFIVLNENSFANFPELEYVKAMVKGKVSPDIFKNSNRLKKVSLTAIDPIVLADSMFANKPQLEDVFLNQEWTGNIPENMFQNSTKLKKVSFSNTAVTGTIPEKLFATNSNLEDLTYCFINCNNLTGTIPEKLFANNPKVKMLLGTFAHCQNLTGKAPKFWESLPLVNADEQNWHAIYAECPKLDLAGIDQNAIRG